MTRYRGPKQAMPFPGHRTAGDQEIRRGDAARLVMWGAPAPREAKARELNERRKALPASYERVADVAGLYWSHTHKVLSGRSRGAWPTLGLLEQAIERLETAARRVGGERLDVGRHQPLTTKGDAVGRTEGAAPRSAVPA